MGMINLPSTVCFILDRFSSNGFEGYIVGGCVRDSLMGIEPHDWDICTSALPQQIMDLFSDYKIIPTGLQHGTITIIIDSIPFEITTFRKDGEYKDNRHPDGVEFVSDLKYDLARRDFTINAMAYNNKDGLIDLFGGVEDIDNKIIRCVGNPNERFQEDALRMLRAIRFAIRYGFKIDKPTLESLYMNRHLLQNISAERVCSETIKTLDGVQICKEASDAIVALSYCLEIIDKRIIFLEDDLIETMPNLMLRLAIIFNNHNIQDIMRELKFSNDIIAQVVEIRKYGNIISAMVESTFIDNIKRYGNDNIMSEYYYPRKLLHDMQKADVQLAIEFAKHYANTEWQYITLGELSDKVKQCIANKDVYNLSDLAIDGNDLAEIGYKGKHIGIMLNELLDMVMDDTIQNTRDDLIKQAQELKWIWE